MQMSRIFIITSFFFFSILFLQCSAKKSDASTLLLKKSGCVLELYLSLGSLSEQTTTYTEANDIQKLFFINGSKIDKNNDGLLDEIILQEHVVKTAPDPEATGVGVLNWEGNAIKMLHNLNEDDPKFKAVEKEYLKAYSIVKELRPNISWGFYGLPFRDYWNRNEKWIEKNNKLKNILAATDVIFPSVYDFYEDTNKFAGRKRDSLYVNDNIQMALQFGKEFSKPVLPFYWHRYHNSNKKVSLKLIPWDEFGKSIEAGLNADYKNQKIAGIIWWGSDRYFYNVKQKNVFAEVSKEKDYETYEHKLIVNYSSNIKDLFKNYCLN